MIELSELIKYSKELKLFMDNGALPQGDVKNILADIYEDNFKLKWGVRKINRGCPSCVNDMMKCLSAEYRDMQVEFKAVPQVESLNRVDELGSLKSSGSRCKKLSFSIHSSWLMKGKHKPI